ncbi:unnamed protein product [Effrenium voratum]|uniref:PARP catalytic domain-containing protein n=1 Tax=Effrenium voratum TaxID=2562239 RepID=A0AA36NCY3_9DINO|nr:unnamed protein product [Effrenium voratum]CAJ1453018.1 unnamed protein product [Effrenium voratum]
MGSSNEKCTACQGSGKVESKGLNVGAALLGGAIGAATLGPVGMVAGGILGGGAPKECECDACHGSGNASNGSTGRVMTMYHGTSAANVQSIKQNGFRPSSSGMLGPGVYVSRDRQKAEKYGDTVLELDVRPGKTKKITSQNDALRTTWHEQGYDSAWVPPNCGMVNSGRTETCVYDPSRIKVKSK